jgi:hypothetical protein
MYVLIIYKYNIHTNAQIKNKYRNKSENKFGKMAYKVPKSTKNEPKAYIRNKKKNDFWVGI